MQKEIANMKRGKRRGWRYGIVLLIAVIIAAIAHTFMLGKLFPYSPIITGFEKHELPHVIVYIQNSNQFTNFDWVDSLVPGVEDFHDLYFKSKPKIFFFADSSTYFRRTPSKARMCAYYNGAITISPWAQVEDSEGKISLHIYLRHELSHALLFKNMSLWRAMHYPKWLLEGIATYSADQMGSWPYPGKEETYAMIRQGNWMPPFYYSTGKEKSIPLSMDFRQTFMYSQFACIVDDLVNSYGQEKFLQYMKELMRNGDHDAVFKNVFAADFESYLENLKKKISAE